MVPFFERSYDWSIETSAKMQGIEPPPVSSFQYLKANVQVQNGKYYIGGYVTGQVVTYAAASEVVKGIPFVGKAIGNAAERLSHLPILNRIGAGHLQNILGGLAVDVVVDTAPETVDGFLEGESVKDIAANTSLNVLENLGWNIVGEGVITGLGKAVEYVGGKWALKGVEGGSGAEELKISSRNTSRGNPNAINHFDADLNTRQQNLLNQLPDYDSSIIIKKSDVNLNDLSALTAKTGDEFAMFTRGSQRLIVRGGPINVNIDAVRAQALYDAGYKWSGHTHPGTDFNVKMPSPGDKGILNIFKQEQSVIYDSKGRFELFGGN